MENCDYTNGLAEEGSAKPILARSRFPRYSQGLTIVSNVACVCEELQPDQTISLSGSYKFQLGPGLRAVAQSHQENSALAFRVR